MLISRSFLCSTKLELNEWSRSKSSCLGARQRIGIETKAVRHEQVFEAVIEGNIVFVGKGTGRRDTIDVDS